MLVVTPPRNARFLQALENLVPLLAEHGAAFDRDRRLPDSIFRALADAGLFRLWLPAALGGPELSPVEFLEVVEAASALDGSVGWLVANGGGMSRAAGYVPEHVARDFFADPHAFIVSATGAVGSAEPTKGGYRLTGRWPFGSGASHSSHFMALAAVKDSKAGPMCCYVPRDKVIVHDTWHVSGLRGTSSCDFEIVDAFVPEEHTHDFLAPAATQPGLIYRLPGLSIFPWSICGAPLGIAAGALSAFDELAMQNKSRLGTTMPLREREIVQSAVGRAEAALIASRSYLAHAMEELESVLDEDDERRLHARVRLRTACAYAAENALAIVQSLATEAGAASIFEKNRLERAMRDVQAAVKHVAMNPYSYVAAGRLRLGLDAGSARF